MPQKFLVKRSSVESKVPAADDLDTGELALNLKDQKLYSKDADGNVFEIGEAENLSNYLEKGDNVSELTNDAGYITVDEVPEVTGFVKLDDGDTQQSIVGGGGLDIVGPVKVSTGGGSNGTRIGVLEDGSDAVGYLQTVRSVTAAGDVAQFTGQEGSVTFKGDGSGTFQGGVTSDFGTSSAQLGNVAPLNDWSCYPARTIIYSAPPTPPPAPSPEPVDPGFGVDKPSFGSGQILSGGLSSAGEVGTQDIIDLGDE